MLNLEIKVLAIVIKQYLLIISFELFLVTHFYVAVYDYLRNAALIFINQLAAEFLKADFFIMSLFMRGFIFAYFLVTIRINSHFLIFFFFFSLYGYHLTKFFKNFFLSFILIFICNHFT